MPLKSNPARPYRQTCSTPCAGGQLRQVTLWKLQPWCTAAIKHPPETAYTSAPGLQCKHKQHSLLPFLRVWILIDDTLPRIRRITPRKHSPENLVRIALGAGIAQSFCIVYPSIHDTLGSTIVPIKKAETSPNLGPSPMPPLWTQRRALPVLLSLPGSKGMVSSIRRERAEKSL